MLSVYQIENISYIMGMCLPAVILGLIAVILAAKANINCYIFLVLSLVQAGWVICYSITDEVKKLPTANEIGTAASISFGIMILSWILVTVVLKKAESKKADKKKPFQYASSEIPLQETKKTAEFCESCGKQIPEGSKYCQYCGTAVIQTIPARSAQDRSDYRSASEKSDSEAVHYRRMLIGFALLAFFMILILYLASKGML